MQFDALYSVNQTRCAARGEHEGRKRFSLGDAESPIVKIRTVSDDLGILIIVRLKCHEAQPLFLLSADDLIDRMQDPHPRHEKQQRVAEHLSDHEAFRAFRIADAAAEAFVAISFRRFFESFFARACPPRLANSCTVIGLSIAVRVTESAHSMQAR